MVWGLFGPFLRLRLTPAKEGVIGKAAPLHCSSGLGQLGKVRVREAIAFATKVISPKGAKTAKHRHFFVFSTFLGPGTHSKGFSRP